VAKGAASVALLRMGSCFVDQSQMVRGLPEGLWWQAPVNAFLVRSGGTVLLFDTGQPERLVERPWALFDPEGRHGDTILPVVRPHDTLRARLREAGYAPGDLDAAITSHWHFDHAGGMDALAGCPILAQRAEIEAAGPDPAARPFWLRGPYDLRPLDGDTELAPGVTVISTPGHTPGHQSLLVETASGAFLLTSDAVYTGANWETDTPGAMHDPATGMRSVARLRDLANVTGARVIFSHDRAQAAELRPFPHWYE
jgi:N-acyl homoserine lactone hydrolase